LIAPDADLRLDRLRSSPPGFPLRLAPPDIAGKIGERRFQLDGIDAVGGHHFHHQRVGKHFGESRLGTALRHEMSPDCLEAARNSRAIDSAAERASAAATLRTGECDFAGVRPVYDLARFAFLAT
jgi:hypothetical protein